MKKIQGTIFLIVASCALLLRPNSEKRPCFDVQVEKLLRNASASAERVASLRGVRRAVQGTMRALWHDSTVELFGSLSTGLGSPSSDADLSVSLPRGSLPERDVIEQARAAFRASPHMYRQLHTRARLPALTLHFAPADITCDIHFRTEPFETIESRLVRYLLHMDERALKLAIIVKTWAKLHDLICSKYLTSYGMIMLVIFFLQQRSVLPAVVELQNDVPPRILNGTNRFNVAFEKRRYVSRNNETLYEMLGAFFEYYENFEFDEFIVSPFVGRPVEKSLFEDLDTVPDEFIWYKRNVAENITKPFNITALCIQDLLMLNDNCAWRVDSTARFQHHFRNAATSYRDNDTCSFLTAIGINVS